jgi:hypothetical protein
VQDVVLDDCFHGLNEVGVYWLEFIGWEMDELVSLNPFGGLDGHVRD